jgi:hypothetical protein
MHTHIWNLLAPLLSSNKEEKEQLRIMGKHQVARSPVIGGSHSMPEISHSVEESTHFPTKVYQHTFYFHRKSVLCHMYHGTQGMTFSKVSACGIEL